MSLSQNHGTDFPCQQGSILDAVILRQTAQAAELPFVGCQHHRTCCFAQHIYMPGNGIYAVCIQNQRTRAATDHLRHQLPQVFRLSQSGSQQAGIHLRQALQNQGQRIQRKLSVPIRQREHHGRIQFGRHDGVHAAGNTNKNQSRAGPQRRVGRHGSSAGKTLGTAQQQHPSVVALMGIGPSWRKCPLQKGNRSLFCDPCRFHYGLLTALTRARLFASIIPHKIPSCKR